MQTNPMSSPSTRAQRRQAIQERMLKNRNLLGRPQAPQENPEQL